MGVLGYPVGRGIVRDISLNRIIRVFVDVVRCLWSSSIFLLRHGILLQPWIVSNKGSALGPAVCIYASAGLNS
jgi:hypothetical protein